MCGQRILFALQNRYVVQLAMQPETGMLQGNGSFLAKTHAGQFERMCFLV